MVADSKPCSEQAEHQERLRAGLVLDIILDGVRYEVLDLEEHLRTASRMHVRSRAFWEWPILERLREQHCLCKLCCSRMHSAGGLHAAGLSRLKLKSI